jgi:hypothetical protein
VQLKYSQKDLNGNGAFPPYVHLLKLMVDTLGHHFGTIENDVI